VSVRWGDVAHVADDVLGDGEHRKQSLLKAGAGDGNRTRVASLEDWGSTIELRPRAPGSPGASAV
jgi:hypothetical protein